MKLESVSCMFVTFGIAINTIVFTIITVIMTVFTIIEVIMTVLVIMKVIMTFLTIITVIMTMIINDDIACCDNKNILLYSHKTLLIT